VGDGGVELADLLAQIGVVDLGEHVALLDAIAEAHAHRLEGPADISAQAGDAVGAHGAGIAPADLEGAAARPDGLDDHGGVDLDAAGLLTLLLRRALALGLTAAGAYERPRDEEPHDTTSPRRRGPSWAR
jgi:hypothetical protein